ncbi:2-dehydropantoate 2-reductase [Bacillus methanolicus]|uniref:2-dehydropantoate 2-reductase n=1 Tax=Bacillus methanolicus TaxID=1471 RepID=UPI00200BAF50|nr:2-dehydropantoate 2-reductase [Bacillus methanolicus]UQD51607.1 2-dehydropantoate 2-reductase [Bacillus methanolicus]
MKVGIIGGGSIGLLFAYYLNKCFDTTIYTRTDRQACMIGAKGLLFEKNKKQETVQIKAESFFNWNGDEDLTVIAVKQYHLEDVLAQIREKSNHMGSFLFLQNGMGHLKQISNLSAENIYIGSVENGAYKAGDRHVCHTGEGVNRVAVYFEKDRSLIHNFIKPLSGFFPFVMEENYDEMLKKKLVVNAVINPLTAILRVSNGELLANPFYREIFRALFKEISDVLHLKDEHAYYQHLINVCQKTGKNRSSMLKDIEENRKTEVDAILGFLLEEARKENRPAPLLHNYYSLIKGIEYKEVVN